MAIDEAIVIPEVREEFTVVADSITPTPEFIFQRLDRGEYTSIPLDEGGEGQVSRVVHEKDGVNVTLKSILLSGIKDTSELDRLDREWEVVRTLQHPNIVRYRGRETRRIERRSGTEIEYTLLADWVEGDPLSEVLHRKSYTEEKVAAVLDGLLETVGYLHSNKVLHRDLKPSNIIKRPDGGLTIIDFGLVKKVGMTTMTASEGRFLGSIPYAAPEVLDGKSPTMASDLYSLGVIAVTLLRGKEFTYRDHPRDIRQKVDTLKIRDARLKETLDALLEEDSEKRMKNFALVNGKYVFGKEISEEEEWEHSFDPFGASLGVGSCALTSLIILIESGLGPRSDDDSGLGPLIWCASIGVGAVFGGLCRPTYLKIKNYFGRRKADLEESLDKRFVAEIASLTGSSIEATNGHYAFQYNETDILVRREGRTWRGEMRSAKKPTSADPDYSFNFNKKNILTPEEVANYIIERINYQLTDYIYLPNEAIMSSIL